MIKKIAIVLFVFFGIALLVYLAWPGPIFPNAMPDFQVSTEPADKETPLRRGYYTNLDREQIMSHYSQQFEWGIRLNYPPENAQTLIRDQTQATYLEEIVHPMRESLFVAGNIISSGKGVYKIGGKSFSQKVIVKYNDSSLVVRLTTGVAILLLIWILGTEVARAFGDYKKWIYR